MTEFRLSRLETVAGNAGRACQQAEQNTTRRWRDQTTPHAGLSDDFNESPHLCVCVCVCFVVVVVCTSSLTWISRAILISKDWAAFNCIVFQCDRFQSDSAHVFWFFVVVEQIFWKTSSICDQVLSISQLDHLLPSFRVSRTRLDGFHRIETNLRCSQRFY